MDNNKDQKPKYTSVSNLNLNNTAFFAGDGYTIFLYKKTEKLVTALYMVSNLFEESEPLKKNIREVGLCLLSHSSLLINHNLSQREVRADSFLQTGFEILSLLGIAFYSGSISAMNYSILKREFTTLLTLVEKKEKSEKEERGFVLSDSFFDIGQSPDEGKSAQRVLPSVSVPNDTSFSENVTQYEEPKGHIKSDYSNHRILKNPLITERNKQENKPFKKDISERKDSRKTIILNLLKKEANLTIKDFTKVIPGCSEKTIQRELLHLVSDGVLEKAGERRWSRYSLKK